MRTSIAASALLSSLVLLAPLARAGTFGVQLGAPGYTDYFSAAPDGGGGILVAGCTRRNYGQIGGNAAVNESGLIVGSLGPDRRWHQLSIADEPAGCAAVAARGPDGALFVAGELDSNLALGGARISHAGKHLGSYAFVARFEQIGGPASWVVVDRSDDPEWAQVNRIAVAANGDVAIAGLFHGKIDWGLGVQKARAVDDGFLVVLDGKTGQPRWMASPRERGPRIVGGLTYVGNELIVAANRGLPGHRAQLVLTSYAPSGAIRWRVQSRGGSLTSSGLAIAPSGDVVVTGRVSGVVQIGARRLGRNRTGADPRVATDATVLRFSPRGQLRWAVVWPGGPESRVNAAAFVGDALWVTGRYRERIDVGGVALTATGSSSSFVARVDDAGRVVRAEPFESSEYVAAESMFADGGDLVIEGDLLSRPMMPWGKPMIDHDTFVVRWSRHGSLPAIAPLALPGWPRSSAPAPATSDAPPP